MAVNFTDPKCIKSTHEEVFGICDEPPPSKDPAYLNFSDVAKWIACVDNSKKKNINLTAIDHCIEIKKNNNDTESSCDCMLQYDTTLLFVELKDRDSRHGWVGKARNQLKITINTYKAEVGLNGYNQYYGYIANRKKPNFHSAGPELAEKFENDTGFLLIVNPVIKIE